jgi:hypothetical protein
VSGVGRHDEGSPGQGVTNEAGSLRRSADTLSLFTLFLGIELRALLCGCPLAMSAVRVVGAFATLLLFGLGDAAARRSGPVRTQAIDMVVIHSTGGPTCDSRTGKATWVRAGVLRDDLREIEAHPRLGIHYMIDRDGAVVASVPEDQVAYHVFRFSGRAIAIELVNDGDGRDPFADAQITSLVGLLRDIAQRRRISRDGVKRHSDLDHAMLPCARTQRRKVDPGDAFPFESVLDRVFPVEAGPMAPSPPARSTPDIRPSN